jgi:hypothetical protein
MRLRLQQTVDALCNRDLHERLWLRGERASSSELGFNDTLLFLTDEMEMFAPADLVGDVLLDDCELTAFQNLTSAVETLIGAIGQHGSFADAIGSGGAWESFVAYPRKLQLRLNEPTNRST